MYEMWLDPSNLDTMS